MECHWSITRYLCVQVAHMTKSEMAYSDASLLGPGALFLNQYFNCPIPERTLLYVVCVSTWCWLLLHVGGYCWSHIFPSLCLVVSDVWCTFQVYVMYDVVKYCRQVCLEICQHLNIMLFTIVPRCPPASGHASEKNGSSSTSKYMTRSISKAKSH